MKTHVLFFALAGMPVAAPGFAMAQAMDPNMPGMEHDAGPVEAQGVGIVKAIDAAKGTITLQHDAIASIHWPAMTMSFKVASPDLLKVAKAGNKVRFTLRPAGMDSTVTSITLMQP